MVQDPSKVGTTLKTISMFLRASKTDAEAAGESTEGMAESVSKLRTEILQLTGGRVDIQLDANTYKNTTEILRELSQVWSSLSDITQANILERIGGKRNANVTAALLENFEIVDKVITSTSNSTGSALAENEKYLDSINGKIAQFKATFQDMSQSILSSELIKLVVDLGTSGLWIIDKIVDGLGSMVGLVNKLVPGLNIIAPLFAAKKIGEKYGIFDSIISGYKKIKDFSKSIFNEFIRNGGTISTIFNSMKTGIKGFLNSGFGKLSVAITAFSLLAKVYKEISETDNRAREKLENIKSEYKSTADELSSVNAELDNNKLRMYELLNLDSLSYVEQNELEKLKSATAELEHQKDLLEATSKIQQKSLLDNFLDASSKTLGTQIEEYILQALMPGTPDGEDGGARTKEEIIYSKIEAYKGLKDTLRNQEQKLISETDEKAREQTEKDIKKTKKSLETYSDYLTTEISTLESLASEMSYGTSDEVDKELDRINNLIDAYYIAEKIADAEDNAFTSRVNRLASTEEVSTKAKEIVSTYEDVLSQIDEKGVNLSKNVFGNIDLNNRKVLEWNKENIKTYGDALKSWGFKPDDISGDISTVMGTSGKYNGVEIAFSPLLQTEKGAVLLNSTTVDKYIFGLIDEAKKNDGKFSTEELFRLDSSGLKVDGIEIKNLLADIGDTAIETAENMHYIGEQGEFKLAYNDLIDELSKEGSIGILTELGKSGEVTLDMLKDICDFSDDTTNELESFIDELIDIGYISDRTDDDLRKVANAFNKLSEEANDSVDEIDDAFTRWEDAQNEIQDGAKFDQALEAINHLYDTVADKTSDVFGRIGNADYKAAFELIIPDSADVDLSNISEVKKYLKDNIKQYFTLDEDGNFKGVDFVKLFTALKDFKHMTYNSKTDEWFLNGSASLKEMAKDLGIAEPLLKAMLLEANEFGMDFQFYELDDDLLTLAQNAKAAAESIEEQFEDIDIELDLTTLEDPIAYIDEKIAELDSKRLEPGVDTTAYNNLTKVMEYYIRQKQLLEQPAILSLDTTQVTDPSALAALNKLIKLVSIKREIEVEATLGHSTKELEDDLNKLISDLKKDVESGGAIATVLGFNFDKKSKKTLEDQLVDFVNGLSEEALVDLGIGITPESFQPAMDAIETMATKIDEIFNGERVLTFDWEKKDGVWKLKINTEDLDKAKKETGIVNENLDKIDSGVDADIKETNTFKKTFEDVKKFLSSLITIKDTNWTATIKVKQEEYSSNTNGSKPEVQKVKNEIEEEIKKLDPNKKFGVNGTAHANGNWSFDGGEALVGELGQELVVDPKNSSWYTVGDHGAEFVNIPKNAIIFNHKQTESLLNNGYVIGRGRALAGGTALSSTVNGGGPTPTYPSSDPQKKNTKDTSSSDDSKQTIDYVEIQLDRFARSLEDASEAADATSRSFKTRSKSIDEEISATQDLITANDKAATTYKKKANSVKLSSSIKEKVRNGDYKITDYDSETADLINQYKEYYEKYLDATSEVTRQKLSKAELQMEKFALTQQKYDSKYELQDAKTSLYEAKDEKAQLEGKGGSIKAQNDLIDIQERRKKLLKEEQKELEALANSGSIKKGTQDWYDLQTAIVEVKADIIDVDNEISKLEQRKVEIRYEKFENIKDGYEDKLTLKDNRIQYYEAKNEEAELAGKGGSINAQKKIIELHKDRLDLLYEEREKLRKQLELIPKGTDEWYDAKAAIQEINTEIANTNNEITKANDNINAINLDRFKNVADEFAPEHSETSARIAYYEDSNTKHELSGNHGSIYAQDKMIEWNAKYIKDLKAEEAEMRDKLKDIDKDSPEYQEAINDLRSLLDKIRDAENKQIEYQNNKRQILFARFQDIQTLYDSKMSNLDHKVSKVNHEITMLETNGYKVTKDFYERQKSIEEKRLSVLQREYNELKAAFEEAVETGKIKKYSQEWYDYRLIMNGVEQSINETEESMASLDKTMRDLEWENFKYLRDTISELNDEADFYIELMSDKDLYDDTGKITEHGMATMGLYAQKYNTYLEEAAANQKKLAEIESELAGDPTNTELIEKKKELSEAIRDNVLAAKDEKQAMIDLVEEGINYELDALQELIDEYKTALDRAKDLHDYEKKVADSTSEIASIRKQISAYQGDDSQEAKLKIQKLQSDLKEAEENLEETEYDRYISDQKELLDEFYNEYETNLNARLDDVDTLLTSVVGSINENSKGINDTLNGMADKFGIKLSGEMKTIWGDSTFDQVVRSYVGEESAIVSGQTSVVGALRDIEAKVERIVTNSPDSTQSGDEGGYGNNVPETPTPPSSNNSNNSQPTNTPNKPTSPSAGSTDSGYSTSYSKGDVISIEGKAINAYRKVNDESSKMLITGSAYNSKYKVAAINGNWIGIYPDNDTSQKLGYTAPAYWIDSSKNSITKYKNGGIVDYTGLAWVDGTKSNPEYMLNAEDTANLMKLTEDLRKLYSLRANITGVAKEASGAIKSGLLDTGKISDISKAGAKSGNSIGDINITIPIERVQDYNDFVTQLKDDPKFDKFIKSVSVDLLDGKSRLAKNKFNWNK